MDLAFLYKGAAIGFAIAAPVGPIGILCIKRTLSGGRLSGFFSGLGASLADTIYGCIGAFGLTAISAFIFEIQGWLKGLGGVFLVYLGLRIMLEKPAPDTPDVMHSSWFKDFVSTFFLTLTNPMTIFSFMAIFAGLGVVGKQGDYSDAGLLMLGVLIGSLVWWLILAEVVSLFRHKATGNAFMWVSRIAGGIIIAFGLTALGSLVLQIMF